MSRLFGKARLCGHVGQSVRSVVAEDILVRDLEDGNTGVHFIKATADHGFLDIQHTPAKAVVIPETALQGPVDE